VSAPSLRYPYVLFDVGDTLIGPRESFGAVYARVLSGLGIQRSAEEIEKALRAHWGRVNATLSPGVDRYGMYQGGEEEYWLRFVEGTLGDRALAARAVTPLRDAFRDPAAWEVFDDVVPALRALEGMGAKLGIVSNWDSRLRPLLDSLGLARWFDAIAVSCEEGMEKPDPRLFVRAIARLGGTPDRALHVGDVPELDEAGAKAAGIASVLVDRRGRLPSGQRALSDLSTLPNVISS